MKRYRKRSRRTAQLLQTREKHEESISVKLQLHVLFYSKRNRLYCSFLAKVINQSN